MSEDNTLEEVPQIYPGYDTGIEPDNQSEIDSEMDPFDPEEISIETKTVSMDTCLRRLVGGTIFLNPDFQRNEVWTPDKKSQLIESLMLMIPLPMFYVSADEKNNYTVVDGLQRLSTIRSFILGDQFLQTKDDAFRGHGFKLQSLEFWKSYEDKNFNELPPNIRNRILESEFRFTVINPGTPEEVRRNIFKRLNTGGMALSSQEIRNALYIGPSTVLLKELAESAEFKSATANAINSRRMEDKELILRFLAFLVRDYTTYRKTIPIDSFLSDTMIIINSLPTLNSREYGKLLKHGNIVTSDIIILTEGTMKRKFKDAMTRCLTIFGKHTFRKSFGDSKRSSINKALFETWGVIMANLSDSEFEILTENKNAFLAAYANVIYDPYFQIVISRDSMKSPSVKFRFEKFNALVKMYSV